MGSVSVYGYNFWYEQDGTPHEHEPTLNFDHIFRFRFVGTIVSCKGILGVMKVEIKGSQGNCHDLLVLCRTRESNQIDNR